MPKLILISFDLTHDDDKRYSFVKVKNYLTGATDVGVGECKGQCMNAQSKVCVMMQGNMQASSRVAVE